MFPEETAPLSIPGQLAQRHSFLSTAPDYLSFLSLVHFHGHSQALGLPPERIQAHQQTLLSAHFVSGTHRRAGAPGPCSCPHRAGILGLYTFHLLLWIRHSLQSSWSICVARDQFKLAMARLNFSYHLLLHFTCCQWHHYLPVTPAQNGHDTRNRSLYSVLSMLRHICYLI